MARKRKRVFIDPSKLVYDPLFYDNKRNDDTTAESDALGALASPAASDAGLPHTDGGGGSHMPAAELNTGAREPQRASPRQSSHETEDDAPIDTRAARSARRARSRASPESDPSAEPGHAGPAPAIRAHAGDSSGVGAAAGAGRHRAAVVPGGPAPAEDRDHEQRERRRQRAAPGPDPRGAPRAAARAASSIGSTDNTVSGTGARALAAHAASTDASSAASSAAPAAGPLSSVDLPSSSSYVVDGEVVELLSSAEEDGTDDVVDLLTDEDDDIVVASVVQSREGAAAAAQRPSSASSAASYASAAMHPPAPAAPAASAASYASYTSKAPAAPLPPPRMYTLNINCIIPGKEERVDLPWKSVAPFYELETRFGTELVLYFNDHEVKPFSSPMRQAPDADSLALIVCTREQFYRLRMGELDAAALTRAPTAATTDAAAAAPAVKPFPVTMDSKLGPVRVQVRPQTTVQSLCEHFCREKGVRSVVLKFDGESLDPAQTVADAEIEADDKLEAYAQ